MMVVTVEVWPGGRYTGRKVIDRVLFANRSELAEDSEYDVWFVPADTDELDLTNYARTTKPDIHLLKHRRSHGALALVYKALDEIEE